VNDRASRTEAPAKVLEADRSEKSHCGKRNEEQNGRSSPYLRTAEAANYCRCGKKRVLRWVRRGILEPIIDPDGRRFFHIDDLDAAMTSGPVRAQIPISGAVSRRPTKSSRRSRVKPVYPRTNPKPETERR